MTDSSPVENAPFEIRLTHSLWVFVIRLIVFELLVAVVYFGLRYLLRWFSIEELLGWDEFVFGQAIAFIFSILEIIVMIVVVLQWTSHYYVLRKGELVIVSGMINRRQQVYTISNTQTVTFKQGLLGRLFDYGQVSIFNPALKHDLLIDQIPGPQRVAELLTDLARGENRSISYFLRR